MKKNLYKKLGQSLIVLAFLSTFSGCGEMLEDPTIDKETGGDINLLIVDFNFFTTRMSINLMDVTDNSTVNTQARVWFTGKHANDIVTFAGEKEEDFVTTLGKLELTVDPNVDFSPSSPFEFTVHVEAEGYEAFSQNIQINNEGNKTFELYMAQTSGGDESVLTGEEDDDSFTFSFAATKSANIVTDYILTYSILKEDLIKFTDYYGERIFDSVTDAIAAYKKDPAHFLKMEISTKTGFPATSEKVEINGTIKTVLFHKLETGSLTNIVLNGQQVKSLNGGTILQKVIINNSSTLLGLAKFSDDFWTLTQEPIAHQSLNFSYTIGSATDQELCSTGCTLNFTSNFTSGFSISADIFNPDGVKIATKTFKGHFPASFILENVPNSAAKIKFRNNNPSFTEIPPLEVSSLCDGTYEVEVSAADTYQEYQIAFKAYCSGNSSVAVAPTYNGYIRIKNSNDPWQGIDMIGGKADFLGKPNQEYEIKLLWKKEWEKTTFSTKFDANGNQLSTNGVSTYAELMEDGRIKIFINHTFEQSICNDLGW